MKEIIRFLMFFSSGFALGCNVGILLLDEIAKPQLIMSVIFLGLLLILLLIQGIRERRTDDEGNIKGGILVTHQGKVYKTGNRYHGLVELMDADSGEFIMNVSQRSVKKVWQKPKWLGHVGFLK